MAAPVSGDFTNNTVDFAASDAAMDDEETAKVSRASCCCR